MPVLLTKMYYTEKTSKVPGWPRNRIGARPPHWAQEDYSYSRPFFEINMDKYNFHQCTVEQAESIPELHHDGLRVKMFSHKLTELWAEIDEYMSNDAHYEFWEFTIQPYWDETSRMWIIQFYHRVKES